MTGRWCSVLEVFNYQEKLIIILLSRVSPQVPGASPDASYFSSQGTSFPTVGRKKMPRSSTTCMRRMFVHDGVGGGIEKWGKSRGKLDRRANRFGNQSHRKRSNVRRPLSLSPPTIALTSSKKVARRAIARVEGSVTNEIAATMHHVAPVYASSSYWG